mgnify:CR=1 FL=1
MSLARGGRFLLKDEQALYSIKQPFFKQTRPLNTCRTGFLFNKHAAIQEHGEHAQSLLRLVGRHLVAGVADREESKAVRELRDVAA